MLIVFQQQEQMAKHIGVDSLGFLTVEDVQKIAGIPDSEFCVGCFTGNYPIEVPSEMPKDKFETKLSEKKK